MNISDTIKSILTTEIFVDVPVDQMHEEDSLRDCLGLDSLGFVELRVQCEDVFQVSISDEDFSPENFATIGTVTALVERLRGAGSVLGTGSVQESA